MGLIRSAIILSVVGIIIKQWLFPTVGPVHTDGFVHPDFSEVTRQFRENFESGRERLGAAFAVYHKGELVVDLWGGYADREANRLWEEHTITVVFSVTKAICSVGVAMLVDRGLLDYDAPVTKYWPEFGDHGKDKITVRQLMSHQAGIPATDIVLEKDWFGTDGDWEKIGEAIENQEPLWDITTGQTGYHMIIFGELISQLCRRVDPDGRSIGQFIRDEITHPHNLDFQLGTDKRDFYRIARGSPVGVREMILSTNEGRSVLFWHIVQLIRREFVYKIFESMPWFKSEPGNYTVNDPSILELEVGGANGVSNARALASIFNLLRDGKLIRKTGKAWKTLTSGPVTLEQEDLVMKPLRLSLGHGFWHHKNPSNQWVFGHPGYGGQNLKLDVHNDLTYAYVTNGLTNDIGDNAQNFGLLQTAVYNSLAKSHRR